MNRDKTKIWKNGLAGLLGGERASTPPPAAARARSDAPPPTPAPPPAPRLPRAASRAKTVVARYGIASLQQPQPQAKGMPVSTRIMPIEQLLGGAERRPAAVEQPAAAPRDHSAARGAPTADDAAAELESERMASNLRDARGRLLRRAVIVALAAVMLLLALSPRPKPDQAGKTQLAQAKAHAGSAASAATSASVATAPRAGSAAASTAPVLAPAARVGPSRSPGLPRAAVDALASGDQATAIRLYAQLASTRPDRPVYALAARILQDRAATRSR